MSRDFTPALNEFREPSRGPRGSSRPTPEATHSTERTREETPRPEARSAYVREPRPKTFRREIPEPFLYDRYRGYDLRESEIQTLTDLGKFRVINADDLARHGYGGDRGRMERETESLMRQGFGGRETVRNLPQQEHPDVHADEGWQETRPEVRKSAQ